MLRYLAILTFALTAPVWAADQTPWRETARTPIMSEWVQIAQQAQVCCKRCSKGQPCGNSCIAASAKCKQPPGCAC
jgi:hypothetical protein